jgi:hypothetical protein
MVCWRPTPPPSTSRTANSAQARGATMSRPVGGRGFAGAYLACYLERGLPRPPISSDFAPMAQA